jgi:hypothetical protein
MIKVILTGLDNAGKTSLLTVLEKIYGFEEKIADLKPTMGINYKKRKYFGNDIFYWDFGGQAEFREKYLQNKHYFTSTKVMYHLIDIQDEERFALSINYLGSILDIFKENEQEEEIPIMIVFSKADDELVCDSTFGYTSRVEMIQNLMKKAYPKFKFSYFSTSIYNPFSIVSLHIKSINPFISKVADLCQIFNDFDEKQPILRGILIDHTGLTFINFKPEPTFCDSTQEKIDLFTSFHMRLFRQIEENNMFIPDVKSQGDGFETHYYQFLGKKLSEAMGPLTTFINLDMYTSIEPDKSDLFDHVNYYMVLYTQKDLGKIEEEKIVDLIHQIQKCLEK